MRRLSQTSIVQLSIGYRLIYKMCMLKRNISVEQYQTWNHADYAYLVLQLYILLVTLYSYSGCKMPNAKCMVSTANYEWKFGNSHVWYEWGRFSETSSGSYMRQMVDYMVKTFLHNWIESHNQIEIYNGVRNCARFQLGCLTLNKQAKLIFAIICNGIISLIE